MHHIRRISDAYRFVFTTSFLRAWLFIVVIGLASGALMAQTTWTGDVNTDWNLAGNWTAGVPEATDDVTIPITDNVPVISVAGAVAKSVTVQLDAGLTIGASGTLTINGSAVQGILNQGTITNQGMIAVGSSSAIGTYGIRNNGVFGNNAGATIQIDRAAGTESAGLYNAAGSYFTNAAMIIIGGNANTGTYGLRNEGTMDNNPGGQIHVDRVSGPGTTGIYNWVGGSFTNNAEITVGGNAATGDYGIINASMFQNTTDGEIHIDRSGVYGFLQNSSGSFTNQGVLEIGLLPGGNAFLYGMTQSGSFQNMADGQVHIDRVTRGIQLSSGSFDNSGTVTIGAVAGVTILLDEQGSGTFNNKVGGTFHGTGNIPAARFVHAGGTLSPGYASPGLMTVAGSEDFANSILSIGIGGTGSAGVDYDRVNLTGTATLGGTLQVSVDYVPTIGDAVTILTAPAIVGVFSSVTGLPPDWYVNYGILGVTLTYGAPLPTNTWTGSVSSDWHVAGNWSDGVPTVASDVVIPNVSNDPVISIAGATARSVKVESGAILSIDLGGTLSINGSATHGIWNQGVLYNDGIIHIGNTATAGQYGVFNQGVFNNNGGSELHVDRVLTTGFALQSDAVSNYGSVTIGESVPVTNLMTALSGTFINNLGGSLHGTGTLPAAQFTNAGGTLAPGYSPGKLTFSAAEDFTDNVMSIEADGTGVPGVHYDQIVVSGQATLGGTLAVTINYSGAGGDQLTIVSATSVSGTFANVTGLPANWNVVYYPNSVVLVYGIAQTTWTGAANTDWFNAGNWSVGVPDAYSDVTIPNTAIGPVIDSPGAMAKSIAVMAGGELVVSSSGNLAIDGAMVQGILNQGTIENNGLITLGDVTGIGTYGILNQATFLNHAGAQVNIDRASGTGSAGILNEVGSTFTNQGNILIGASVSTGTYGIRNNGVFSNNAGALVQVDRASGPESAGIYNPAGSSFTNAAMIVIGGNANPGQYGIRNQGTMGNNPGGQIHVDRVSGSTAAGIYNWSGGSFTNAADVFIGANGSSGQYGMISAGTVQNNAGGQIQIDRSGVYGLVVFTGGSFTNQGVLDIGLLPGGNAFVYGISHIGTFNNLAGGQVHIDRVTRGIEASSGSFQNDGTVTIGAVAGVTDLMYNQGSGLFNNKTGGTFQGTGNIPSARFVHAGGTLSPGYSPGLMTIAGNEDFTNSILSIEINGTGTAGVHYDRVNVAGTATLGGTLQVSINYVPTNGDEVTILSAMTVSGTFATITGLPSHWDVVYTADAVKLRVDARNTWNGSISTDWNTAGNWSGGVPDAMDDVVIPDVANDPVISTTDAQAKTVHIESGAMLTIQPAGVLTTYGVTTVNGTVASVYNQGTLQTGGVLNVQAE